MQLTQKETSILKELKSQEQLCIDKYTKSAACAADAQLKDLCTRLAGKEQQHLNTLTQIETGTVPAPGGAAEATPAFTAVYSMAETPDKKNDCFLCTDLLTMEKHASHLYDMGVFEFRDENVRKVLNHIQAEEQGHGKAIYDYMAANSMYAS